MGYFFNFRKENFILFPKTIEKKYSITRKSYGALTSYKTKILMYFVSKALQISTCSKDMNLLTPKKDLMHVSNVVQDLIELTV